MLFEHHIKQASRQSEQSFYAKTQPWSQLRSDPQLDKRFGITGLVEALSTQLITQVLACLPDMEREVSSAAEFCTQVG